MVEEEPASGASLAEAPFAPSLPANAGWARHKSIAVASDRASDRKPAETADTEPPLNERLADVLFYDAARVSRYDDVERRSGLTDHAVSQ
jgi:hypothetical protein